MDAGVGLFTTDVPNTLRLVGTLGLSTPDALYAFVVDFGEEQAYLGTKWYYVSSSVFMTVGDADKFWHPQFFSTVTFESQRSTEEERSWSLLQPL